MLGVDKHLSEVLETVRADCGMDRSLAYCIEGLGADATVTLSAASSMDADGATRVCAWVATHGHPYYSIPRPERSQRNRAMLASEVAPRKAVARSDYNDVVQRPLDIDIALHDQVRVLVCEGPLLLAWVGGFRRGSFGPKNRAALQRWVPVLRALLAWERRLRAVERKAASFDQLLDCLHEPTLVVDARGKIEEANAAARARVAGDPAVFRARVVAAIRGEDVGFDVRRLDACGMSPRWLVVARGLSLSEDARQPAALLEEWKLTPREREVALLLARGLTSKEIAMTLGCALTTVHVHIGRILQKAGVDSRAKLAAKMWGA